MPAIVTAQLFHFLNSETQSIVRYLFNKRFLGRKLIPNGTLILRCNPNFRSIKISHNKHFRIEETL